MREIKNIEETAIAIYCIVDDMIKKLNFKDNPQAKMSSSEILTVGILACLFFGCNYRKALAYSKTLFSYVLDESRFLKRLKRLLNQQFFDIFYQLVELFKHIPASEIEYFAIDSFPIPVCENIRANRCRLAPSKEFRGYVPAKRTYIHGLKLHIVASSKGFIKEFVITPASFHDIKGIYLLPLDLPEGSVLYADKAYNDYFVEDMLMEAEGIKLEVIRKKNSKKKEPVYKGFLKKVRRRFIETIGSELHKLLPKKLHATSLLGFLIKLHLLILSFNFSQFLKLAS